jgi:hypothetical protein
MTNAVSPRKTAADKAAHDALCLQCGQKYTSGKTAHLCGMPEGTVYLAMTPDRVEALREMLRWISPGSPPRPESRFFVLQEIIAEATL